MTPQQILIIGGGLGGLAAANGLLRAGHRVRVFERAPELGELGAGIMLTPNAVRAIAAIGAFDRVRARAVVPEYAVSRHYQTGEPMGRRSMAAAYEAAYGEPMLTIHRVDLLDALVEAAREIDPEVVRTGHELVDLGQDAGGVEATFANGVVVRGDALIAADGIRSGVCRALGLQLPPLFAGLVAWRGLIPVEALPPHLRSTNTTSWVGPDRHIIEYTVGDLKNYVAIARQSDWRGEGWTAPSSVDDLLGAFGDWHEDIVLQLRMTPPEMLAKWALHDRDPLPSWRYGGVVLIGDAAHPMLPLMAQGSAMAMEDGVMLARAFAASADVAEAFDRLVAARHERVDWVQLRSRETVEMYHSVEKDRWTRGTEERAKVLYTYDVTTVPV